MSGDSTVVEAIIQVPHSPGRGGSGFAFVHVKVTSEDMPASAFTVHTVRHLGAALGASLADRPDPERYRGWLEFYRLPEVPDGG